MAITIKKGAVTLKKPQVEKPPAGDTAAPETSNPPQQDMQMQSPESAPMAVMPGMVMPQQGNSPHLISVICGGLVLCIVIALIIFQLLENSGYRGYFPLSMPPAPQLSVPTADIPDTVSTDAEAGEETGTAEESTPAEDSGAAAAPEAEGAASEETSAEAEPPAME